MNIGKKVKAIRTEKLMTQNELSGELITRNMLSQIENGIAQPSLATVCYLAERLGVPAGYLLSEGEEEFVYNKTKVMRNIKKAYLDRDFQLCRDMCISSFDEFDDELELILTDCSVNEAEELIRDGKLYAAREMLDETLRHSSKTIYSTTTQKKRVFAMFFLLRSFSPTLDSNEADTDIGNTLLNPALYEDVFCKYISAIFGSDDVNEFKDVYCDQSAPSEHDRLLLIHLDARHEIKNGDYKKAATILQTIMNGETVPERLLLYMCCTDMEKCCTEMGDYKGAYEFSKNKMEILEHMLVGVQRRIGL